MKLKTSHFKLPTSSGFSLLDIVMSIAIVGAMAVAAGTLVSAGALRASAYDRQRATLIAENMLEAARALPPGLVTERTNGAPLGIILPWGRFNIEARSGAPSSPQVLATTASSTAVAGTTSAIPLPADVRADVDLTFSVYLPSGSPSGWRAGALIRAQDLENGYRLSLGAATMRLEKIQNGTVTSLVSKNLTSATATWYTLRIVAAGSSLSMYRNGVLQDSATDATFTDGRSALTAEGGALPLYDSVTLPGAASGNFDGVAPGQLPPAWRRLGPAELPGGSADLTVAPTFSAGSLKTVTARVLWQTPRGPATVSLVTYHP